MERTSARAGMVESQLLSRGVDDVRVVEAFRQVPRHRFVSPSQQVEAYGDHPLPIACGQTISQPYVVAYMLQSLELRQGDSVLEIGTGSGYLTALLATIVERVFSVEYYQELAGAAERTLFELGCENVSLRVGDGAKGWPGKESRFDAIIGSAAAAQVPPTLIDQLAEGGRMIVPVGEWRQHLVLLRRTADGIDRRTLLPVRFVPLQSGAPVR